LSRSYIPATIPQNKRSFGIYGLNLDGPDLNCDLSAGTPLALPSINEEIERREAAPASIRMKDDVLRLLLAVRRKGQREPDRERNP
jgi:hypothetical protein